MTRLGSRSRSSRATRGVSSCTLTTSGFSRRTIAASDRAARGCWYTFAVSTRSRPAVPPSAALAPPSARGATSAASPTATTTATAAAARRPSTAAITAATTAPPTASGVNASSGTIGYPRSSPNARTTSHAAHTATSTHEITVRSTHQANHTNFRRCFIPLP